MQFQDFWYIVAASGELRADEALARCVLGQRLVCFRGPDGAPAILPDRCLHRNAPLSLGSVRDGEVTCPYHGWRYASNGRVTKIPSQSPKADHGHCLIPFDSLEIDGYVYVRLKRSEGFTNAPWRYAHHGAQGWRHVRFSNRFANTVTNCVENFIDIPHTAFVHTGIFRTTQGQRLAAVVERKDGAVKVVYQNERANLGTWSWFLNPKGEEIRHTDSFFVPNVTCVTYEIGKHTFIITSQSVPVGTDDGGDTLVYTDLTYNFGVFNDIARPFVRHYGQRVIDQDVRILAAQMENITQYGAEFHDTPADVIHRYVESLRAALARGQDPRALPPQSRDIEFFV